MRTGRARRTAGGLTVRQVDSVVSAPLTGAGPPRRRQHQQQQHGVDATPCNTQHPRERQTEPPESARRPGTAVMTAPRSLSLEVTTVM